MRRGGTTDVMQKMASRIDPACSLSIITAERSLDLTLPNGQERDSFIRGLKLLLEAHPTVRFV